MITSSQKVRLGLKRLSYPILFVGILLLIAGAILKQQTVDIAGAAAVIFAETLVICSGAVGKAEKRFAILLIIIGVLVICKVKFQWYE